MNVLVYVEGPSDRTALEALLRGTIEAAQARGVGIRFPPLGNKVKVLTEVARKAVGHLSEHPTDWVFALPDLYPMRDFAGTVHEHRSPNELRSLLHKRFADEAGKHKLDGTLWKRFRVHCLKHDLEVLVLAALEPLRKRLKTTDSLGKWREPVEDQNDTQPPKRVVEQLFQKYLKRRYVDVTDAPAVLARADINIVRTRCQQCFRPFLEELEELAAMRELG